MKSLRLSHYAIVVLMILACVLFPLVSSALDVGMSLKYKTGTLSVDAVNGTGTSIADFSVDWGETYKTGKCVTMNGTIGSSTKKVKIKSFPGATNFGKGFKVEISPKSSADSWTDGTNKIYINEEGCNNGLNVNDQNSNNKFGRLTVDPSLMTVTSVIGSATKGVTKGTKSSFSSSVDSITVLSTSASADEHLELDLTGIALAQEINSSAITNNSAYTLNMVMTITKTP